MSTTSLAIAAVSGAVVGFGVGLHTTVTTSSSAYKVTDEVKERIKEMTKKDVRERLLDWKGWSIAESEWNNMSYAKRCTMLEEGIFTSVSSVLTSARHVRPEEAYNGLVLLKNTQRTHSMIRLMAVMRPSEMSTLVDTIVKDTSDDNALMVDILRDVWRSIRLEQNGDEHVK